MKKLSSHIKHITEIQNLDYYDTLTDEEKENFDKSTFFIWEKLGLCMDLVPIIAKYKTALTQRGIKGRRLYIALTEIIPKGKYQFKQIYKGKKRVYIPLFVELLKKEYNCSETICKEYIDIYSELGVEMEEYDKLKKKFGKG